MKTVTIQDAYSLKNSIYIDVRSPSEYRESSIPGAINIPVFSDKEREDIGITYRKDINSAYEKGFRIASTKLFNIYQRIKFLKKNDDTTIVVFCWRGGMRSKSIVCNLNMMGIPTLQLIGGYKAYRKYVIEGLKTFENFFDYVTIHGNTGVGKTILLKNLEKKGQPILNLEGLANNRGSMFGSIGLGDPMNQKMFDSLLFEEMRTNNKNYFLIESESKRIGNIIVPDFLMTAMKNGKHILIEATIEQRIENIINEYLPINNKNKIIELIANNKYFKKQKGIQWVESLLGLLEKDDYYNFVKILLLDYYDPLYYYSEKKYIPYDAIINNIDSKTSTDKLISIVQGR